MEKDFDGWNSMKKSVHKVPEVFGVHQREFWWVSFGVNVGVEIDGKNESFERPAIILRKFNNEMMWALPVTSQEKVSPFYARFSFDDKHYFAVLTQLRTVSTKRLLRKIGMIPKKDFTDMQTKIASFVTYNERNPAQGGVPRRPKP